MPTIFFSFFVNAGLGLAFAFIFALVALLPLLAEPVWPAA